MPWPLRRAEWLSGRLAAKELLRLAFALEPSRVEVLPEKSGAPAVWVDGERHPVQLNLSHTRTWAVAAAAEFTVGVDVADDADGRRLPKIERRVMSGDEAAQCAAHSNERTQAAVWAVKEAGLKLRVGGVFSPGARSVHILSLSPAQVADPTMTL
jgi:phosphopantetheinyl transferase (holo-ACP synthase)